MDPFDAGFVEERGQVGVCQLYFLTIHRGGPAVWRVLRFDWRGMTQSQQRFGDIAGHGDVHVACCVVPIDCETEVASAGPILGDGVLGG